MTEIYGVAIRHLNLFRERLSTGTRDQRFREIACMFVGAPYDMGSENFNAMDCSGLICSTLNGMGFSIRVNANDIVNLMAREITRENNVVKFACFYNKLQSKYTHIGVLFHSPSEDTILHASYPTGCYFEDFARCKERYESNGYKIEVKQIDWDKVKQMDGTVYDLDSEFI